MVDPAGHRRQSPHRRQLPAETSGTQAKYPHHVEANRHADVDRPALLCIIRAQSFTRSSAS